MASLRFLVTSKSATKPYTPALLLILIKTLPYFHAESEPGARFEFIAVIRTAVQRLRGATLQLSRLLQRQNNQNRLETGKTAELRSGQAVAELDFPSEYVMGQHLAFLKWYTRFLVWELQPTASYQRHITALKTLTVIFRSGLDSTVTQGYLSRNAQSDVNWSVNMPIFQPLLLRMSYDLSMDPFDDVREAAVLLINMSGTAAPTDREQGLRSRSSSTLNEPSATHCSRTGQADRASGLVQQDGLPDLMIVLSRARTTLQMTGRADHADGVARLFGILNETCVGFTNESSNEVLSGTDWWCSTFGIVDQILTVLEEGLLLAKNNLRLAVSSAPIHGHLAALRYRNLDTDSPVLTSTLLTPV